MDYFEGGDLQGVIDVCRVQQKKIHPLIALMWSQEIVKGMKICHENDIIHRDLKPENGENLCPNSSKHIPTKLQFWLNRLSLSMITSGQ